MQTHKLRKHTFETGFTMVELLVVVTIIGIIASIAISEFSQYRDRTNAIAAFHELRDLKTAFAAYVTINHALPTDVTGGTVPAGMEGLVPNGIFSRSTPIGGIYNWDGPPTHNPSGIGIEGPTVDTEVLENLDKAIDDGNLATGEFRTSNDGHYMLLVEE